MQTPEETLRNASGSCRDSGWLLVQLLRHCGLAARFVSGYLIQLKPDVKALDGPSGTEVDFTDLHAWCEVYLPGAGWIGLDPTSGLLAGEGHIPLACTPEPSSAAPIEGAVDECRGRRSSHEMKVTRIYESPRVTKPYTEEQWAEVLALGEAVDARAAGRRRAPDDGRRADLRRRRRPRRAPNGTPMRSAPPSAATRTELVHKLRAEYGQGGFLHFGQGKWYPGEQLPRWALSICWRADGQPCWHDPALFADEREPHALHQRRRAALHPARWRAGWASTDRYIAAGLRGRLLLPVARAPAAGQRRPVRLAARRRDGARAPAPRVHAEARRAWSATCCRIEAANADADAPALAGPGWKTGPWFLRDDRCT